MKKILLLWLLVSSYCFADNHTLVINQSRNYIQVQCNKWGWLSHLSRIYWKTSCTPLEIVSIDGNIHTVTTTANQCNDQQAAIYEFKRGYLDLSFAGCHNISLDQK